MVYDGDCRVPDSLNNVMQTRFCGGYCFGKISGKRRKLFEALGAPVPDAEPEKEQDYEDEEETEIKKGEITAVQRPVFARESKFCNISTRGHRVV